MMPWLRSVLIILFTFLWTLWGLATLVVAPGGGLYMYFARVGWSRHINRIAGAKSTVQTADNIDWSRPYVICVNHQSQLDITLLFANLPVAIRFLAKRDLFYIPIFGWSLALTRFIPVDRGRTEKARRSIERAAERIRRGPSLVVFPEGTRTPDGSIRPFKSGAFILAIKAQVPILPVSIKGTHDMLPKNVFGIRPGNVEMVVGEPISTEGFDLSFKEELKKRTRDAVISMFESGEPWRSQGPELSVRRPHEETSA